MDKNATWLYIEYDDGTAEEAVGNDAAMIWSALVNADLLMRIRSGVQWKGPNLKEVKSALRSDWVRVQDSWPEHNKSVLVYGDERVGVARLRKSGEWQTAIGEGYSYEVTHWQHLPAPPSGEKEGGEE